MEWQRTSDNSIERWQEFLKDNAVKHFPGLQYVRIVLWVHNIDLTTFRSEEPLYNLVFSSKSLPYLKEVEFTLLGHQDSIFIPFPRDDAIPAVAQLSQWLL